MAKRRTNRVGSPQVDAAVAGKDDLGPGGFSRVIDEDPTIEPEADIVAQLSILEEAAISAGIDGSHEESMGRRVASTSPAGDSHNTRRAVWFSRRNFIEHYRLALGYPKERILINFDGLGGVLVARSKEDADEFRQQKRAGIPVRAIIGMAIGAGTGKPNNNIDARIVQLRTSYGAVIRETAVPAHEAASTALAWGPRAVILTVDETLARRQLLHNLHTLQ